MLKYFKLVEIAIVQVLGNMEDEQTLSTLFFMKSKLQNGLNEHLPMVVNMYSQTFFTLNFLYDEIFEKWQKMKSKRIKVSDLLEYVKSPIFHVWGC
jgi:hypothetical protein